MQERRYNNKRYNVHPFLTMYGEPRTAALKLFYFMWPGAAGVVDQKLLF
jgi:hypothetical protein